MLRFDHIALYVSDLEKSSAFYQNIFGLETIPNPFPGGKVWFRLDKGFHLHLIENEGNSLTIPERSHFCFSVSSMENFLERLVLYGIHYSDFEGNKNTVRLRPDGIRQIYFQDPDGYWWEVNDSP